MEIKIVMSNILTLSKNLNDILNHATIEASNSNIRNIYLENLNNSLNLQNDIYNFMVSKGYYQVTNVEQTKIDQVRSKLLNN